jgi:hypothetical protein
MYIGSCGGNGRGCGLRASQGEHLMARADQFLNNGRTDKACSTCYEYTHHNSPFFHSMTIANFLFLS